eukprot:gene6590-12130_t
MRFLCCQVKDACGIISSHLKRGLAFGGIQQYIGIIFDEMKIRNDLVFDKMSGQLIGYVDLGDPVIDYVSFEDNKQFAQYALVFMIRDLCTSLKAVFSYHLTGSIGSTAF